MENSIEKFEKSANLHIFYAFLLHVKLSNIYRALTECMIVEDNKPTSIEEFTIYCIKCDLEDTIQKMDEEHMTTNLNVNFDF